MALINTRTKFKGCIDSRKGGRIDNQDSCGYADTPLGLLVVVCDGMGGGPGGKLASSVAVETIINMVKAHPASDDRKKVITEAVSTANINLLNIVAQKSALSGMGTTVTALLINERSAIVAHVGDSRVYQFRRGQKKFRTYDHSRVFEFLKKGEQGIKTEEDARLSSMSNIITRALGHGAEVKPDVAELPYEKGDRFMLCTDGVWGCMPEKELVKIAGGTKEMSGAIESLFITVNDIGINNGGTHDNFSAAFVETTSNSILKETMSTKTRNILIGLVALCGVSIIMNFALFTRGSSTSMAEFDAAAQKSDSTIKACQDSINKLKAQNNNMEKKIAELEGVAKGMEKGINATAKAAATKPAPAPNNEKRNIIDKLDQIIKQLQKLQSSKSINKAIVKDIEAKVNNIKDKLTVFGCNAVFINSCLNDLKENKSGACQKMIGEANALKRKVEAYK